MIPFTALPQPQTRPQLALEQGHWVKLICGASYQDLPTIRDLALVYTLAGVDCIDMAADPAVLAAVREGVTVAQSLCPERQPWLMISLNDGEDPHFRKAVLGQGSCVGCAQPCVAICPAAAIAHSPVAPQVQIASERCYGCGRCLPVCPPQRLQAQATTANLEMLAAELLPQVDAVEIHTQVGHQDAFARLWRSLDAQPLRLVAISCPDGPKVTGYLKTLLALMQPRPKCLVWQTDGRPMSGDIGAGTAHAAVRLAQKVLNARLPGHVQLAGGTNAHTATKLKQQGLLGTRPGQRVAGVAYGSCARRLVLPLLQQGPMPSSGDRLWEAVRLAQTLIAPIKQAAPRD